MPGLIRGVARTAVIAGTATAVSNNVSRRQAGRWQAREQQAAAQAYSAQQYQQAQAAPPPPAPAPAAAPAEGSDLIAELTKLGELRTAGLLSDAEFEAAKAKLLAG